MKKFFMIIILLLAASCANAAEEDSAATVLTELSAQFQTLQKELSSELGADFPSTSELIEKRMKELTDSGGDPTERLQALTGDDYKITSDDVQRIRGIGTSLYSSYSTYNFSRKEAERIQASAASADTATSPGALPSVETLPNMGLAQAPPYSIEAYDTAIRSLEDRRKRLTFDLFSLKASEKAARDGVAEIKRKKTEIAGLSDKKTPSGEERLALAAARLELELARVNVALQLYSVRDGITTLTRTVNSIKSRAKQVVWMSQNLSFTDEQRAKITARGEKSFADAQKYLETVRKKNSDAERAYMQTRNQTPASSDTPRAAMDAEITAQYYYTRLLLTYADDMMNYATEALDLWNSRYKLFKKELPGDEIWKLRDRASKRIVELENKLDYIRRTQKDVSTRERDLLVHVADTKDAKQKKSLTNQANIHRNIISEIIEPYSIAIPNHIFLFQRLFDEAGKNLDTVRLAEKVTATGKDIFLSIMNTKLWEGEGYNFTVEKLILALGVLLFGFYGSRLMSRLVQRLFWSKLSKNTGAAVAVQRLVHYFILFIIILLALQFVNIPITAFAFLGGALALGFGFGAQNFFNNIISGFILMFSSPFKVGDIVDIDGTVGTIAEIGERSTVLRTFTNLEMVIPNSYLLQNKVTNWTSDDQSKRETLLVGVSYNSDPKDVREILGDTLARHKEILKKPEPYVIFKDFGASALVFELYYWVDLKKSNALKIGSDLRYMITSDFRKKGVEIPFPQMDVHVSELSPVR